MSRFKKLIDKLVMGADTKTMQKIGTVIDEHLTDLEAEYPKMFWEVVSELHEVVNGEHFDEEMAKCAVSQMKNEDGTTGPHWTYEQTTAVAASNGILFNTYNGWDFYYAMNMWYSDFYGVIGNDTAMYVKFVKAWLEDKDVNGANKSWLYWSEVAC